MGGCNSSASVETKGQVEAPGAINAKWDGRSCEYICPAPYEQVCKHIQFDSMPTLAVGQLVTQFKATGNAANCKRDLEFISGTPMEKEFGAKIEEICTFAQENGHGYAIAKGKTTAYMPIYRGSILVFRIPDCADKCLVTFSCTYQTSNAEKAKATVDTVAMVYKALFE